jgi:malate dehydrogenase (oxaloacetate-decarboxylating)
MNADEIKKKSLNLHRKLRGKIEVLSKMPVTRREDLSLLYTPGVAEASSAIAENINEVYNLTIKGNTVAVVTDGSAVLGLGNIGPEASLPVMEGKALLFKEFAGIDAFPIALSTQDTEEIIETVKRIAPVFGGINLEDISAPRCFEIERRLKDELPIPVFHDDQHGTAIVVLAGLINALRVRGSKLEDVKIVINGAGAAGTAVAKLLLEVGAAHLVVVDSKGAIHSDRGDLSDEKKALAELTNKERLTGDLGDIMKEADVFIGVSKGGLVTSAMVQAMNEGPIIFALANPVPEIMPDLAKEAGALVVATGRSDFPNQLNNVLAFPGVFRGALDNKVQFITREMIMNAAENLAGCVEEPGVDNILPPVFDKRVVEAVSSAIK